MTNAEPNLLPNPAELVAERRRERWLVLQSRLLSDTTPMQARDQQSALEAVSERLRSTMERQYRLVRQLANPSVLTPTELAEVEAQYKLLEHEVNALHAEFKALLRADSS